MPLRSSHAIIAAVFGCFLLWLTFRAAHRPTTIPLTTQGNNEEQPYYDLAGEGHILGHGIVNFTGVNIEVSRIHIQVSEADISPLPLLQPLDISLPPPTQITINTNNTPKSDLPLPPIQTTNLNIPRLPHTLPDASSFIFGVSTTYERLEDSLPTLSHWLSNTSAPIIGHMSPSLDPEASNRVSNLASSLHINLGTIESHYEFLDRYFGLLKVLHANRLPTTKWYVFIDDDTFFLSMRELISAFAKYDPEEPWYIGALTEDFSQMATWGYFAYGGGGIFLSHVLVEQLLPHYDECFKRQDTGDRMIAECIYRSTTTKFTWEPRLHQLDLHGDQSGFYEALRPQPLSLHHWKSEEFQSSIDIYNLSRVAAICGDAFLLQKFRLKDDWVLTNGFSLVKYSSTDIRHRSGKWEEDVSMERTWDFYYEGSKNVHFEYSLGPIRNRDEEKISYRMESAVVEGTGNGGAGGKRVRQLYVRRKAAGDEKGHRDVEGVVEVTWSLA